MQIMKTVRTCYGNQMSKPNDIGYKDAPRNTPPNNTWNWLYVCYHHLIIISSVPGVAETKNKCHHKEKNDTIIK